MTRFDRSGPFVGDRSGPSASDRAACCFWRPTARLLLILAFAAAPGCKGCWWSNSPAQQSAKNDEEKTAEELLKEREEKLKELQDFEIQSPIPLPAEAERQAIMVKPGHWMTSSQEMKVNNFPEWVGTSTQRTVDKQNDPLAVPNTTFTLTSSRPVALTKGTTKFIDTTFYIPPTPDPLRLRSTLRERSGGGAIPSAPLPAARMLAHQYHIVVLAREPERYGYIDSLYCVKAPYPTTFEFKIDQPYLPPSYQYRVVAPKYESLQKGARLPDSALSWTTTAFVLWDDIDPELLSQPQRTAMVDWLHWGGQLIVSGPDSLALLRDSFLAPLLPATSEGARELNAADLESLANQWSVTDRGRPLRPVRPWAAVQLDLTDGAQFLQGAEGLVAERRVGRGRVVVSAFQLTERDLINWSSGFDNFFNAVLFRRPSREFVAGTIADPMTGDEGMSVVFADSDRLNLDATDNTHLRYFSRDEFATPDATRFLATRDTSLMGGNGFDSQVVGDIVRSSQSDFYTLTQPAAVGGVGAWNDSSATANAARAALREAAGVDVPTSRFVIVCLAVYLVVLAPLNWFIFHILGRVEWAWIAAPIIALVGAYVVINQAQLNMGFVRAQTEVAVLETHGDYPRAHLTRYTALYTSLSTTYDFEFDNQSAVAAPFPRLDSFSMLPGQRLSEVSYGRQDKARLTGLQVDSATTDMVHSEEYMSLDGPILLAKSSLGAPQIQNRTTIALRDVAVVKRTDEGAGPALLGCWIGDIGSRESAPLALRPISVSEDNIAFQAERASDADAASASRLNLEQLMAIALDPKRIPPGETRLVARADLVMSGVTISPAAAQVRGAVLVVAHLEQGPLPAPKNDVNAPIDVRIQASAP